MDNISENSNFSKYHFLRLFKGSFGLTPHQYLIKVRLIAAKEMLKKGYSVKDACFEVGFESVPSFNCLFKKAESITPTQFIKRNEILKEKITEAPLTFVPGCFAENFAWQE